MRPPLPRRPASLVLVTSLAVLAGVGVDAALGSSGQPGARTATARPEPVVSASARPEPVVSASAPDTSAAPALLEMPRLGIRARIVGVGVEAGTGVMELPDARRVGWYRYGSRPGDAEGSAVLAGHVDSRTLGLGALFPLREARAGDQVRVTLADGRTLRYRVVAATSYLKRRLPADELFARAGAPLLHVVTCGGRFRPESGGYEENVVVTAAPDRSRR